jgi:hypothetical protein
MNRMASVFGVSMLRALGLMSVFALAGCASSGGLVVSPESEPFDGLKHLVKEVATPQGGARASGVVHVMLIHGMSAKDDPDYSDIIKVLRRELDADPTEILWSDSHTYPAALERVRLGGAAVWPSPAERQRDAPRLRTATLTLDNGVELQLHAFDYWQALATLKCRYLIGPDASLVGSSEFTALCADHVNRSSASSPPKPRWLNKQIKNELVAWGFADAVIATSDFREVLRAAVLDSIGRVGSDVAKKVVQRAGGTSVPVAPEDVAAALDQARMDRRLRMAIITRSLGSYVLVDALSSSFGKESAAAAAAVVCRSDQVHLLANQLSLLTLSEISVNARPSIESDAASRHPLRAFNAGCKGERSAGLPTPQTVVAYHEPNDMLTMWVPEDGYRPALKVHNVVVPFAKGVPWLFSDPLSAHIDQMKSRKMVDVMINGYRKQR